MDSVFSNRDKLISEIRRPINVYQLNTPQKVFVLVLFNSIIQLQLHFCNENRQRYHDSLDRVLPILLLLEHYSIQVQLRSFSSTTLILHYQLLCGSFDARIYYARAHSALYVFFSHPFSPRPDKKKSEIVCVPSPSSRVRYRELQDSIPIVILRTSFPRSGKHSVSAFMRSFVFAGND